MSTRWRQTGAPRGEGYDARWRRLEAAGQNVHGEADLVERLLQESGGTRVLDAGCGTGRVAIELAARGFSVVGVDADPAMLAAARTKSPELVWIQANLADLPPMADAAFDLVVLAGNVMILLDPGSEGRVLSQLASLLAPAGLLVSGFSIRQDRLQLDDYDQLADFSGLEPVAQWSSWDRAPFAGGDYAVSVHRRLA